MQGRARRLLYRLEMRIAQECGRELAMRPFSADPAANAWGNGLVRAWKQIRKLRETGEIINFDEHGEVVQ